jgi:hypothetical protein
MPGEMTEGRGKDQEEGRKNSMLENVHLSVLF